MARDHDGHRLASPSQFYFASRLGLVDYGGQTGSGFGDGVFLGHAEVYIMMYMTAVIRPWVTGWRSEMPARTAGLLSALARTRARPLPLIYSADDDPI